MCVFFRCLGAAALADQTCRDHAGQVAPGFQKTSQRRVLVLFGAGAVGFLLLSAFGSYQTYHYAESTQFCGEVWHKAISPEMTAYKRGASCVRHDSCCESGCFF